MENKTKFHTMLEWLEMTFGSLLIAVGVYFFKVPNGFSLGGVSGISTLLGKVITWSWVTPGMLMFGLNVILLIIGFIVIGKDTGIRTAYCSLAYSGMTWILGAHRQAGAAHDRPAVPGACIRHPADRHRLSYHVPLPRPPRAAPISLRSYLKSTPRWTWARHCFARTASISAGAFLVFGLKAGLFSMLGLFAKAFPTTA